MAHGAAPAAYGMTDRKALPKLNRVTVLDHANRPKAPKIANLTTAQRQRGRLLSQFHDFHRQQLTQVQTFMRGVEDGALSAAALATTISDLQMAANYRRFGNLCGQECRMLSGHHGIEDANIFPILHHVGSPGLRRVVERLAAEHLVVHELIEELNTHARIMLQNPNAKNFAMLKNIFTTLDRVVRSHFGYEETELEEALGVIDVGM